MRTLFVLLSLALPPSRFSNALPLREEPAWLHASLRTALDTSLRITRDTTLRDTTIVMDSVVDDATDTIRFTSTTHHRKHNAHKHNTHKHKTRKYKDRKPNKDGLIEVFCPYIIRHGKIIYPKHGTVFHFFVKPKDYHPRNTRTEDSESLSPSTDSTK